MSASTKPMSNELMPPGTGMMAVAVKVSSAEALPVGPNVQGKAIAKRQANPFRLIVLSLLLFMPVIERDPGSDRGAPVAKVNGGELLTA
jgi:hypothetical protein